MVLSPTFSCFHRTFITRLHWLVGLTLSVTRSAIFALGELSFSFLLFLFYFTLHPNFTLRTLRSKPINMYVARKLSCFSSILHWCSYLLVRKYVSFAQLRFIVVLLSSLTKIVDLLSTFFFGSVCPIARFSVGGTW